MKNLINELKERKIRKWLAIYLSSAITIIGVVNVFSGRYNWPSFIFDTLVFSLLFGLLSTIFLSWFHGKEQPQKFKIIEIIIQSSLILGLLFTIYFKVDFGKKKIENHNNKVIAVLPFTDFNETKDNQFFADGITDDILTQLSKISDFKVISRTSVMKYKNTKLNLEEIAKELGAGSILEGSVRTSGNKIRIVGQLIDASSDTHLWSETYDRELNDIFKIQTEISEKIAEALNAKLLPIEKELIETNKTDNFDAYIYYSKGRHEYFNFSNDENEKAIEFFKKAIKIDSNYALAFAGLAEALVQKVLKYNGHKELYDSSITLSSKALTINSKLPEAYKALATAHKGLGNEDAAIHYYKRAIELNPNYWDAILNYGQILLTKNKYDEAFYWISKAHNLAPDNIVGLISLSMVYKALNCYSNSIDWANKALALQTNQTFNAFLNSHLADLYLNTGDYSNARKYFKKNMELDSTLSSYWYLGGRIEIAAGNYGTAKKYLDKYLNDKNNYPEYYYAFVLLKIGKIDSAKIILEHELNSYKTYFESEKQTLNIYNIAFAEIFSILNDKEKAFDWWEKGITENFIDIKRITQYPYFENLKNDSRYVKLLESMKTKIREYNNKIKESSPEFKICN
ncbi:MAG: tetratricopeptide repeat protein [Melioribacteraceae bacterium]